MSSAQPLPEVYRRRQPEATALYQCVQEHLDELATRLLPETLPAFVERELSAFLTCGILAYGFARVRCTGCGFDRLVAFACKGRGLCPSCVGRRMAETSAYLVEQVFPEDAPVRQWVLSLPKPVRALVAYDASLLGEVLSIFVSSVRQHLRRVAKQELGLGVELLARLVSLIPPPRVHMIRYHGVFAPRSRLRAQVVRAVAPGSCERHEKPKSRLRLDWAKLLLRVFEVDVLTCPRCESGRLQRIAFITSGDAIRAILTSVGLSTAPPERRRVPAQVEMAWV